VTCRPLPEGEKEEGKLYFSSTKALKTSRMGRKKLATERYDTNGINKVLDFEDIEENATLSTLDEYEGPSKSQERRSQSRGTSKDMGTQSNPASNITRKSTKNDSVYDCFFSR
jgi:hypothetical protein